MTRTNRRWLIAAVIFAILCGLILFGRFAGDSAPGVGPTYQSVIDRYETERDCVALQDSFDGTNDVAKMEYIDDAMRDAGCYDD